MKVHALLISVREESLWFRNLESVLSTLGKFQVVSEDDTMKQTAQDKYDLIVVDAATVHNERRLLSRLHGQQPQARIVVVTASPTWERAREALQAGAVDYISKFLSQEEFLITFKKALGTNPQSWSK